MEANRTAPKMTAKQREARAAFLAARDRVVANVEAKPVRVLVNGAYRAFSSQREADAYLAS